MSDWLAGRTPSGREVRIPADPYTTDSPVYIDGETTYIYTARGVIYRPTPFKPDLVATLDGEPLA